MKTINILFYANLRVKFGDSTLSLALADDATVNDVLNQLREDYPRLRPQLTETIVISINHRIALAADFVPDGAEMILMPPVGGGQGLVD
ncbi:MAG: MoaD/ThiS family protein [Anaerolineaceae bacterium]|nr:MoaD/ThiS family protein [Anaerolineaceae bacterium]